VLTDAKLEAGKIYECESIGLMEQIESAWSPEGKNEMEEDHNVLACLVGEQAEVTEEVKNKLTEFVSHVFDHLEGKVVNVGAFLGKEAAEKVIIETED